MLKVLFRLGMEVIQCQMSHFWVGCILIVSKFFKLAEVIGMRHTVISKMV